MIAAAVLMLGVFLAGCGREPVAPAERERPEDGPYTGGTLTIALQADATRLDPHQVNDAAAFRMVENMYSTLMRYAEEFPEIEPDLVASYEVSEDYTHFELTIREDAYFGVSGRNVTAEDVVYSLNRIRTMETRDEPLVDLESMEATGEHTLELRFAEPMVPLMNYLAHPMYAIVDREVVETNDGDLSNADAGSGPFRLVEWRRGQRMALEADPDYYVDGLPYLERLVYRPIEDETARVTALSNGEVDIILDTPVQDIDSLDRQDYVHVDGVPGTFWEYIGINVQASPFDDARVRQAIAWALDREALNEAVQYGHAEPIRGGHIPEHHWAYADLEIYPEQDVARAQELLAEAGYADGLEAELIVGTHSEPQVQAAGMVRQMLAPAGIELTVRSLESTIFFDRLNDRDFQLCLVGWVGLFDPDEWLYPIYHTDGWANQQNYSNSELDRLLEQGRRVPDRDERQRIYAEAQELITLDAPTVYLYLNDQTSSYLNDVWDFQVHPTATTISLRQTWLGRDGEAE